MGRSTARVRGGRCSGGGAGWMTSEDDEAGGGDVDVGADVLGEDGGCDDVDDVGLLGEEEERGRNRRS